MIRFFLGFAFLFLISCNSSITEKQITLYYGGLVYTCDSEFNVAEALAVSEGKVLATGKSKKLLSQFPQALRVPLEGKVIYPGLFDAHCHFYALGRLESQVNVAGCKSWSEVLEKVNTYVKSNPNLEWIVGRGWDQTRFKNGEMPTNKMLDSMFPDLPILLRRVDGHAALASSRALELAHINNQTQIDGGEIEVKAGMLTGLINDNAVDELKKAIPKESNAQVASYLLRAQELCLKAGLTSVTDAGLSAQVIQVIDSLYEAKQLFIRINAMISADAEGLQFAQTNGPILRERFRVQSFKIYGDGALGSRGALLKKPYCDRQDHNGMLLTPVDSINKYCQWASDNKFQICTHAIGDSANRLLLDIYGKYTQGKDLRWRIEHAQVVDPTDQSLFKKYSVIPSVQPTHATSDMRWAKERLCTERLSGAYAYQDLLKQLGLVALGTDFPIEDYKPNKTFYAAVFRKDKKGFPASGFQNQNALTKKQALLGMTTWAAYAQFDEDRLGQLKAGFQADFVISEEDWFKEDAQDIWSWSPFQVVVNGQVIFDVDYK